MLRNTLKVAASAIIKSQCIRKMCDTTMKRSICMVSSIKYSIQDRNYCNSKTFSTNAPNLQKDQ